ncbi:hypothetical protein [Chenggangzhangella methanolivorans]|uniref:Fe/B12 periplasmic-binding domain-containing protein n=1 Tax=Chenggangzhangella methanolivorans TaxID=1437009 RepID=A0A9E6R7Q3_9HYPH|nr:hypothetical protein [Chenggangzhangella methanolivorans]QZN98976.1 hypothetical protein K6K41_19055 [Chenggangzhangella methanolivorans]
MLSRRSLIAGAIGALAAPNIGLAAAWRPKRIIAIGGPITEILFGLGCGDQIVAVDQTSRFPGAARRKGDAGFHDDLSAAQLLSHAPDLVVSGEETSIADVKDALARSSVRVSSLKSVRRASDVTQRIRAAGDAVGDPGRAARRSRTQWRRISRPCPTISAACLRGDAPSSSWASAAATR